MKKPSTKRLNIGLLLILCLTFLGFLVTLYSLKQSKSYTLDYSKYQLNKINNTAIKLVETTVQHQKDLLKLIDIPDDSTSTEQQALIQAKITLLQSQKSSLFTQVSLLSAEGTPLLMIPRKATSVPLTLSFLKKDPLFSKAFESGNYLNGEVFFDKQTAFLNIYQPLYNKQKKLSHFLVGTMDLSLLSEPLEEATTDANHEGYTMIKNLDMEVIIHPSRSQIGLDIIKDRQEVYPNLDYTDLKKLEREQLSHQSGTLQYSSYWWTSPSKKRVQKIAAYRWIKVGNQQWIVASSSDFDKYNELHTQEIITLGGLISLIFLIFLLISLYMKRWIRSEKIFQENQQLLAKQSSQKTQYELEKNLLQESKLEIVGLLTTSIVHDMNNFLTPLLGNIELLMAEYQNQPELLFELNEIYLAAQKGHDLSQHVLNFSKVTNNERAICSLSTLLNDSVKTMQILIPKKVIVTLTIQEDVPLYLNPDDIQAIIYNLMINAVQALNNQGNIDIQAQFSDEINLSSFTNYSHQHLAKRHILLTIKDNGPGIPEAIQKKIFTPFFTTKSSEGGTGLGLFIVHSIIKKNDWLIKLQSSEKGTAFLIALPIESID